MKKSINSVIIQLTDIEDTITSWNQKKIVKRINFSLVILVSFIAILQLNLAHPIFGDDWGYSLIGGNTNQRIKNISEIFSSQYHHYFDWGGRTIVHIIAQFLLMIDEKWADLLNSLAYILLTLVIYKIAIPSKQLYPSILILINLLICFFQVSFGSTMLWITGSANYLWGTLIILVFLYPYIKSIRESHAIQQKDSILKSVLFICCGIIAGWTNENMGIALIIILFILILVYKQQNQKMPRWMIWGIVGACIGFIIMTVAPGNYVRYETSLSHSGEKVSLLTTLFNQTVVSILSFYNYSLSLAFILILIAILSTILKDNQGNIKSQQILSSTFFFGAIIATLAMSASPIFPGRASFGINSLIIVSIVLFLGTLDFKQKVAQRLISCLVVFGLLFYSIDYYKGYKELTAARVILDSRVNEIQMAKQRGDREITFHDIEIVPKTRYLHYYELRSNTYDWHNEMFSLYHQLDSVKFIIQ